MGRSPFRLKREHLVRLLSPKSSGGAPCSMELLQYSACITRHKGSETTKCMAERKALQDCSRTAGRGAKKLPYRASLLRSLAEETKKVRF